MRISLNNVYNYDSIEFIRGIESESVDMIYFDPPFNSQKMHTLSGRSGKEWSFGDTWNSSSEYSQFIRENLREMNRVLKETGSIYIHCDWHASHIIRNIAEDIFGIKNFRSEIIWSYKKWSNSKKGLINSHQTIFLLTKSDEFTFNRQYEEYSPTTNIDQILQLRVRGENNKAIYKTDSSGKVEFAKNKKGVPLGDVWDIPYLNPKARERVGYPTQKPVILLERMIKISTNPGDIVLDSMCGSGTVAVAAKLLDRKFIINDISAEACALAKERLIQPQKTTSAMLQKGRDSYLNKENEIISIVEELGGKIVQRNKGIDGLIFADGGTVAVKVQEAGRGVALQLSQLENAMVRRSIKEGIFVSRYGIEKDLLGYPLYENIKIVHTLRSQI